MNHSLAQLLGPGFTALVGTGDPHGLAVVRDHLGVVDGQVVDLACKVVGGISALGHDLADEALGAIHDSPGLVDEAALDILP